MFASRLCGVPFSFTAHAKDIYVGQLNPGDTLQTKMRRAKFIVTCTRANSAYLQEICKNGAPVYTIYHGLDTRRFAPSGPEKQHKREQDRPLILSVGRFVEKKGFTYLVEACRLLRDRGYDFRCMLIGGVDAYLNTVEALIKELQLEETVLIRGAVTQEELKQIYEQGTAFVLPCQIVESGDRDGIPNVLVEAMALELPVVSTDVSGIPELIDDGVNGLLVPQRNATALADAIESLLKSPSLCRQLGLAARAKVRHSFNAEDCITDLHDLFQSCLEPDGKVVERTLSSGSAASA
jgi:glycosyltransferase involved in cell wall biosynthesis